MADRIKRADTPHKFVAAPSAIDVEARTVSVVASSSDLDRHYDRVMPGAWRLDHY